jgi:hypothetical protein
MLTKIHGPDNELAAWDAARRYSRLRATTVPDA